MSATYSKVRFIGPLGAATAGLVFERGELARMTVSELSARFPMSEAMKMQRVQISRSYPTWNGAFAHEFERGLS